MSNFSLELMEGSLKGVAALDFCWRMNFPPLQEVKFFTGRREVTVPDWFVRAHAPSGELHALIDPAWLQPGEVRLENWHGYVLFDELSPERIVQLMVAFLDAVRRIRIEDLESSISEAIAGLEATRNQFESAAIADIRRMLERTLYPPQQNDQD